MTLLGIFPPDETMFQRFSWLPILVGLALPSVARGAPPSEKAESFQWQTAAPESQGMSGARRDALKESLAAHQTAAFLVVRNDQTVYEWYAPEHGPFKAHFTASLAKAIVGGVSCGVAMTDRRIRLDDRASQYIPQWRLDPRKSKITIRQLGSHTSGLEDSSVPGIAHPNEPGWKGEFWKRLDPPSDPFTISRDTTPVTF